MGSTSVKREPAWFTTGDLVALAIGGALASSTFWFFTLHYRPQPGWVTALEFIRGACYRAALALVPVVLYRRAVYGGVARPAEFPIGHIGIPFLFVAMEHWPSLGLLVAAREGGFAFTGENGFWAYLACQYAIALAAAFVLIFARRRLPDWARMLALWLAWMGVQLVEALWRPWVNSFLIDLDSIPLRRWLGKLLIDWPWTLAVALPMVAAVLGMIGPRGRGRTWTEWVGVALLPALFLSSEVIGLEEAWFWIPTADDAVEMASIALIWASTLAVGVAIVRRFGPAFGRWIGAGHVDVGTAADAEPDGSPSASSGPSGRPGGIGPLG